MTILQKENWHFEFKELILNEKWTISRNSSHIKNNLFISYGKLQSEAAPNIRYGEDQSLLEQNIKIFINLLSEVENERELLGKLDLFCHSFRFAVSTIIHQFISQKNGQTLFEYLGTEEIENIPTSFSIPILDEKKILNYLGSYSVKSFSSIKIKIKNQNELKIIKLISENYSGKIRIDANEGIKTHSEWKALLKGLHDIKNIEFIEQPFPSSNLELYKKVKENSPYPIILDESIETQEITNDLVDICHGINVKLMKSSDLLLAAKQLNSANDLGLKTMIGCMIESSLGISFAMHLAFLCDFFDLDGHLLIKNDPFSLIKLKEGKISLK